VLKKSYRISPENKEEKSAICVRSELYEELMKEAEEKLYNIYEHIENIIDTIVVINISERKFFDVKLHENFILCEQDKLAGCDHTAFVWMQAEDLQLDSKF